MFAVVILNSIVRAGLIQKVPLEQMPEGSKEVSHVDTCASWVGAARRQGKQRL